MSQEKVRLLKAFGAEVIVTPTAVPPDHPDHYVMMARRIAAETPNAILADQFYNQANPDAHYATTGPELWEQTERAHHALRRGGRYGRHDHRRRAIPQGAEPPHSRHRGRSRPGRSWPRRGVRKGKSVSGGVAVQSRRHRPGQDSRHPRPRRDRRVPHRERPRELRDGAAADARRGTVRRRVVRTDRARRARRSRARSNDPDACVVTFLCDTGERYLSKLYSDEWMRENQMLDPDRVTLDDVLRRQGRRAAGGRDRGARRRRCGRRSGS